MYLSCLKTYVKVFTKRYGDFRFFFANTLRRLSYVCVVIEFFIISKHHESL